MKNILFRTDASTMIGIGHVMRDIVLAKQMQERNIRFACRRLPGDMIHHIPFPTDILCSMDNDELVQVIRANCIEMLVIDHYGINHTDEKYIKDQTGVKIFVFDDFYKKHQCDYLLNQSLHADPEKYRSLVPADCKLFCGREYILIEQSFYEIKTLSGEEEYILITLGGGNISKELMQLISCIEDITDMPVLLIAPQIDSGELGRFRRVKHISFRQNLAKLMHQAKFLITSLGMTFYEGVFLDKSLLAVQTAENQKEIAKFLSQKNLPVISLSDLVSLKCKKTIEKLLDKETVYPKHWISPEYGWVNRFL
jgi:UDP-2,4-diacetamido-2,4,6-trideoxy-beta-L-altropyranose hydrolase